MYVVVQFYVWFTFIIIFFLPLFLSMVMVGIKMSFKQKKIKILTNKTGARHILRAY